MMMNKLLRILAFFLFFAMHSEAQILTKWVSQAVVPGEKTFFYIQLPNVDQVSMDRDLKVEGASLRQTNVGYTQIRGAGNVTALFIEFEVIADKPGIVTIPSFALKTNQGDVYHSGEQILTVYPFSAIQWQEIPDTTAQFGTLWHIPNKTPFIYQPVNCELKLYTPTEITFFRQPVIEKNGITANNFLPALNDTRPKGTALVRGRDWNVISFISTVTPIRSGEVSMSGSVLGKALRSSHDPILAQFMQDYIDIPLPVYEEILQAKNLPPGAPKGFTNAVGDFKVNTSTQALDLSANEPVIVNITIEGRGNIDNLECPAPDNASDWKLYPATKVGEPVYDGDIGTIHFQQSMRPVQEVSAIPAFSLSYFNPETEKYNTVSSSAIPLPWKHSGVGAVQSGQDIALPPPAGIIPVDQMADIYGSLPHQAIDSLHIPFSWQWYLLAYIPFVLIVTWYVYKLVQKQRNRSLASRERQQAFKELDSGASSSQFLRSVGTFIETKIPEHSQDEGLQAILNQRDAQAFLPENSIPELTPSQRSSILATVKTAISRLPILTISLIIAGVGYVSGNETEAFKKYDQGEFSKAVELFSNPADNDRSQAGNYFGAGNSYYRLNKPGEAALSYRRALNISPGFIEASRNLQFIERKEGAILPPATTRNEWLTFAPFRFLLPIILLSGALSLTFLSLLIIRRKNIILLSMASLLSLLALVAGITNYYLYPETPDSIDPDKLLVVTQATEARSSADKDSPSMMKIPASTPLIMIAERGSWIYVKTFTGVPAWINAHDAKLVTPPSN